MGKKASHHTGTHSITRACAVCERRSPGQPGSVVLQVTAVVCRADLRQGVQHAPNRLLGDEGGAPSSLGTHVGINPPGAQRHTREALAMQLASERAQRLRTRGEGGRGCECVCMRTCVVNLQYIFFSLQIKENWKINYNVYCKVSLSDLIDLFMIDNYGSFDH